MSTRTAETVDAWYSPGCDTRYSVSLCDEDGEITCIGGSDDIEEAWEMAVEYSDERGIEARLMPTESGEVTRRHEPDA